MVSPAKRHAKFEHIEMFGSKIHFAPGAFHVYARYYLESAQAASLGTSGYNPARYYLTCRTIELCLKAFLSTKGYTMERLSEGALGHNIKTLLDHTQKNGLNSVCALSKAQLSNIEQASIYYNEKVFEYPALLEAVRAYPSLPDCDALLDAATLLVADLRASCLEH